MTERAARHVAKEVEKSGGVGLRLGVREAGCTGYAYVFDIAREVGDGDHVYESHGAKLVVNDASLAYLRGSELDYVREGLGQMFKVNNPNVKASCGCGESFAVEDRA
jgi:iron-sulfur cluster assembly protein